MVDTNPDGYVPPPRAVRLLARVYLEIFGRKRLYGWNELLLLAAARGLCVSDPMLSTIGPAERAFLRRVGRLEAPTVLDVGANQGAYSAELKSFCPSARIWAFEPGPSTFKHLATVASRSGFLARNLGLSERPGTATLFDYAVSEGSTHASLYREVIEDIHDRTSRAVQVDLSTVDDVLAGEGIDRLTLLKIDTEGHELSVLKGASKSLDAGSIDIIQFEFNEMNVVSRVFMRDYYDILNGFTIYRMMVDGLAPLGRYRARTHELFFLQNLVAIRDGFEEGAVLR